MTWVSCYSAAAPEAHLAKGFLEHRGVPCLLRADGPAIYPVPAFGVCILVPEEWLPVARRLLERRRTPQRGRVVRLPVTERPS